MEALAAAITGNPLETLAALFGMLSVYLSVREHIWSWPTAIVNVSLYFLVFRDARLYADMALQIVYLLLSVYGWYEWLHGGAHRGPLQVSRTPRRLGLLLAGGTALATAGIGLFLARRTNAALPWLDSAVTTASLAAQFMMTRKLLENWLVWIAVDIVYVGMFIDRRLYLTALLYAVFLGLATMGWFEWRRSWRAREAG